jgi:hypothetical protein
VDGLTSRPPKRSRPSSDGSLTSHRSRGAKSGYYPKPRNRLAATFNLLPAGALSIPTPRTDRLCLRSSPERAATKKPIARVRIAPATAPVSTWMTAISAAVEGFRLPLPVTMVIAASCRNAAEGAPDEAGDAVSDEAEPMFVGGARCGVGTEEARDRLDRQSPQRHAISPGAWPLSLPPEPSPAPARSTPRRPQRPDCRARDGRRSSR